MSQAFDSLPVVDQIRHVQDLWDQIAQRPEQVPVPEGWPVELESRLARHRAQPEEALSLQQLRSSLDET